MKGANMKKKGFTLVELLVVIAIIAMLLAILMPALGKVRQLAQRIMCSTNLGGIGKAMLTYISDDEYESYPVAGPGNTVWNYGDCALSNNAKCDWEWRDKDIPGSAGNPVTTTPPGSTVSACLYLLVKFADVPPDQFNCPGGEEKEFDLSIYDLANTSYGKTFADVWDFGYRLNLIAGMSMPTQKGYNSYSYQMPFLPRDVSAQFYPLTTTSNPAKAIMADKNPFWDHANKTLVKMYIMDEAKTKIDTNPVNIIPGNNVYHQGEGQNVLYVDQHVRFEKTANCAVESDNIYTTWGMNQAALDALDADGDDGRTKTRQAGGDDLPGCNTEAGNYTQAANDDYLINDYN